MPHNKNQILASCSQSQSSSNPTLPPQFGHFPKYYYHIAFHFLVAWNSIAITFCFFIVWNSTPFFVTGMVESLSALLPFSKKTGVLIPPTGLLFPVALNRNFRCVSGTAEFGEENFHCPYVCPYVF